MAKLNELNIASVIGDDTVDVKISTKEHDNERESRLQLLKDEAEHQRRKDLILFYSTIGVVVVTFCICVFVILSGKYAAETEKTMLALLTLIIGGLVGYLTGKSSK